MLDECLVDLGAHHELRVRAALSRGPVKQNNAPEVLDRLRQIEIVGHFASEPTVGTVRHDAIFEAEMLRHLSHGYDTLRRRSMEANNLELAGSRILQQDVTGRLCEPIWLCKVSSLH